MKRLQFDDLFTIANLVMWAAMLCTCVTKSYDADLSDTVRVPPETDASLVRTPTEDSPTPTQTPEGTLTVSGWFTIVWNAETHNFITSDEGHTVEVLLDEQLTKPHGGPLALDRRRVTIVGVILSDAPMILQAQSIAREADE
ncbi:MAG: hypothetical protein AMJ88_17615 [Anaerolineae bacterium SM23_ 63]|nr:MAG: hypothetical protein AMJ88_17615 [Anaerolineae bacterium SM23_ 63]